jgi:hypothetical protein
MNATVTPQVESFVDALMASQHDAAVHQVFADYLEAECGWSAEDVLPLRDGSLTGRNPYNHEARRAHGWVTNKPTPAVPNALPGEVFQHLPRSDNQPRFEDMGDLRVWVAPHDSLGAAWEALRTALVAWAGRDAYRQ